jgi:hypothetical protein
MPNDTHPQTRDAGDEASRETAVQEAAGTERGADGEHGADPGELRKNASEAARRSLVRLDLESFDLEALGLHVHSDGVNLELDALPEDGEILGQMLAKAVDLLKGLRERGGADDDGAVAAGAGVTGLVRSGVEQLRRLAAWITAQLRRLVLFILAKLASSAVGRLGEKAQEAVTEAADKAKAGGRKVAQGGEQAARSGVERGGAAARQTGDSAKAAGGKARRGGGAAAKKAGDSAKAAGGKVKQGGDSAKAAGEKVKQGGEAAKETGTKAAKQSAEAVKALSDIA